MLLPSEEYEVGENEQGTAPSLSMPGAVGGLGQNSTHDTCYGDETEESTAIGVTDAQDTKAWSKMSGPLLDPSHNKA